MKINLDDIKVHHAKEEQAHDWTTVFLKGLSSFRWISRYLKEQNLTDLDVSISFIKDLEHKKTNEILLIAYLFDNIPVGIIRAEEYWLPQTAKILSHFPLVFPRYQHKGIGKLLVKTCVEEAFKIGYQDIWAECWSKDQREIQIYQEFYKTCGFDIESKRFELNCNLEKFSEIVSFQKQELSIDSSTNLTQEFVEVLSESYSASQDKLHSIENLGEPDICKKFLLKTKEMFELVGLHTEFLLAKYQNKICAALMIASSNIKGMVLEIGVLPSFRKLGIAQTLITNYLTEMKERGAKEVVLGVDQENIPAIALYKKLGFRQTWLGKMFLLKDYEKLGLSIKK